MMAGQTFAQCKDSDFPAAEGVTAAPSRPGESFVADPLQVGVLESGVTRNWQPGSVKSDSVFKMLRLGVWCNFDVRWSGNNYRSLSGPGISARGLGDTFVAGQYRFLRESPRRPALAISYTAKIGTADDYSGLGAGKTDHFVTVMGSKNIG
jgi:hypothetical protein